MPYCKQRLQAATLAAGMLVFAPCLAHADSALDKLKISLQSYTNSFVSENSSNGLYYVINKKNGMLIPVAISGSHPVIFKGAGYFVTCVDGVDTEGKTYLIDFYVVGDAPEFRVVDIEVNERSSFMSLVQAGKAEKL